MTIFKHMSGIVRLVAAAGLFALVAVLFLSENEEQRQPIAFNHKTHFDNNVSCAACHQFYGRSPQAGFPGVEVCQGCHEDVLYVSSEKKKLLKYVTGLEDIPWKQVYQVPEHVLFSHKRHIVAGKLECSRCHGDVAQVAAPITKPAINLDMDACIECHRTVFRNPNECLQCHR